MPIQISSPIFLHFADSFSFAKNDVLLRLQAFLLQSNIFSVVLFLFVFDLYFAFETISFSNNVRINYGFFFYFTLDLHLSISGGFVKTNIYDKRDGFDFDIVNFPFLDGDVPRSTSYGVYIYLLECPVMLMTLILVIRF